MIGYVKHFDSNKKMFFKVNDNRLLKSILKYRTKLAFYSELDSELDSQFDSELVYGDNDKYTNAKINSYVNKENANFQGKKYQKKMYHISVCH